MSSENNSAAMAIVDQTAYMKMGSTGSSSLSATLDACRH
jgi:hypothetical protein